MSSRAAWPTGRLGDHAYIKARIGWRGLSSSEYTDSGPYLIAGNHIVAGRVNWPSCDHLSMRRYEESWEIALRPGDVILTKDGTIGRAAILDWLPGLATINGTMMLVRPRTPLVPRYVYHYLTGAAFQKLVLDKVSGSSIPHIFQRDMQQLPIPMPLVAEQEHIADVLDSADAALQQTEALIGKLKLMRAGLLHDLLSCGLDDGGQVRDPDAHPEQFRETSLGRLPRTWRVSKLDEVKSPDRAYIKTGPFGSTLKGEHWVDEGVPVITIGSLGEGNFIESELLHITASKAESLSQYAVEQGDLVFSRVADVGRSVVVTENEAGWIMSSNLMRISLDQCLVVPEYGYLNLVYSNRTRKQIRQSVNAGGREVANTAILNGLQFAWPPPDEQKRILYVARAHDARIRAEEAYRDKLKLLKQGLMDDLLTGRVRVPVTEEAAV